MLIILNGIIVSLFLFSFAFFNFFKMLTRYSILKDSFMTTLESIVRAKVTKFLIITLFITFFIINLSGNIPLNSIPTLFYSQTLTISLLF